MNGYELSRAWFDWCFENPEKIKPIHTAIYFFAIEHCNRLGWKEKFGFPSQMTMDALGIKKFQTYSKALREITEWGFIEFVEKSKNQYSANIIRFAVPKKGKAQGKALDKAFVKHKAKQLKSTGQGMGVGMDTINKQVNNITNKQEREARAFDFLKISNPVRFETEFQMRFSNKIKNKEKFVADFNDKVDVEEIEFTERKLFARLSQFARNWVQNQDKFQPEDPNKNTTSNIPIG